MSIDQTTATRTLYEVWTKPKDGTYYTFACMTDNPQNIIKGFESRAKGYMMRFHGMRIIDAIDRSVFYEREIKPDKFVESNPTDLEKTPRTDDSELVGMSSKYMFVDELEDHFEESASEKDKLIRVGDGDDGICYTEEDIMRDLDYLEFDAGLTRPCRYMVKKIRALIEWLHHKAEDNG